jgi:hypothetical protein
MIVNDMFVEDVSPSTFHPMGNPAAAQQAAEPQRHRDDVERTVGWQHRVSTTTARTCQSTGWDYSADMKSPERVLVWLLRLSGAMMLTALGAVFMPYDWMNLIHQRLGMGELPHVPIVGYLTRSVSALYALHGALLICVSLDVRRYLPIVRFLGVAGVVTGILLFGLDRAVEMPVFWTHREGPFVVGISVVILVLAWRVKGHEQTPGPPSAK